MIGGDFGLFSVLRTLRAARQALSCASKTLQLLLPSCMQAQRGAQSHSNASSLSVNQERTREEVEGEKKVRIVPHSNERSELGVNTRNFYQEP